MEPRAADWRWKEAAESAARAAAMPGALRHAASSFFAVVACAFLVLALSLAPRPAQAACADGGCVTAGPRLASVSSTRGPLLNLLLGQLLGTSLSVTASDWNTVATTDLSMQKLVGALQAQLGASSPTTALATNISLDQLLTAAATAATNDNQTALALAINQVRAPLTLTAGNIRLGDLLSTDGGLGQTKLNALSLITGAIQLYNTRNVVTTNAPIAVSGSSLGLGSLLQQVTLSAQVIEAPVYVCGPVGSTFHTAAMRIKLNLDLVALNVDTSLLTALVGVSSASLQVAHIDLYVEVARANGIITAVDAVAGALSVQATPGIADLYLGQIADNVFFNRSRALVPATDLTPGVIGSLKINALTVALGAKAYARGQSPSASLLTFTGPYSQTRTAYTQAGFTTTLLNTLVGSLQLSITPSLGTVLDALVLPVVRTLVQGVLSPLLTPLLSGLVDPLLEALGIRLGEVDVTAGGTFRVCGLTGSVYQDSNHNLRRDVAEAGTSLTLYAKLVPTASPSGPAQAVATVDPTTGSYSFTGVGLGSYLVVVNASSTMATVTPAMPSGWIGTEAPTLSRSVTVAADTSQQNFGLFRGSTVSGKVFIDIGAGGGTANNGVRDGTEAALPGRVVRLLDSTGTVEIDRATTADQGSYTLWLPYTAAGTVQVADSVDTVWVSVGGSAGTTGGTYAVVTDRTTFTAAAGLSYTGVDFADVPANRFDTDGLQSALPGAVVFYPHRFVAGTAGTLTLTLNATAGSGWTAVAYEDTNCNGRIDTGEALISASRAMTAGQSLCMVVKVAVPPNAAWGTQLPLSVVAQLAYANNALVGQQTRTDLTNVGDGKDAGLLLQKQVDKAVASLGDTLTYTMTYGNQGTVPLSTLRIIDQTPAYTVFVSADCGVPPSGGPTCSVAVQPAAGAVGRVEWQFTGALAPGATGWVRLVVQVQ